MSKSNHKVQEAPLKQGSKRLDVDDLRSQYQAIKAEINQMNVNWLDPNLDLSFMHNLHYISSLWADFRLYITQPKPPAKQPAEVIEPEYSIANGQNEWVYPIVDYGYKLSTSRGKELLDGYRSMGKLLNTVEKMIKIAMNRARIQGGGIGKNEVDMKIAIYGHEIAQRKAYEQCLQNEGIHLENFEPGEWENRPHKIKALFNSQAQLTSLSY